MNLAILIARGPFAEKKHTIRTTAGQTNEKGKCLYFPTNFPLPVTRLKICMSYACLKSKNMI